MHPVVTCHTGGWFLENGSRGYSYGLGVPDDYNGPVQMCIRDRYRDAGGNLLDSANVYGKFFPAGTNICDIHIGNWLKSRGCRNRFIVETKGGHPDVKDFTRSRLDIESVRSDIEESLAALQTDSIDLFYLHRDDRCV